VTPSRAWIEGVRESNRARLGLAGMGSGGDVRRGAMKTALGIAVVIGLLWYWRKS